jgi:hypothetical protein
VATEREALEETEVFPGPVRVPMNFEPAVIEKLALLIMFG